jgi:hypothetical protein
MSVPTAIAANDALKSTDVLMPMHSQGVEPLGGSTEEFGQFIGDEIKKWTDVVRIYQSIDL